MADYEHVCENIECKYEWEASYSIKAEPPKICPKCNQETAKRLISLGSKGVVELTGNELVAKVKDDAAKLKKDMHNDSKIYSNLLGEDRYQSLQQRMDKQKRR